MLTTLVVLGVLALWTLGWVLALRRPEVLDECSRWSLMRGEMVAPPPAARVARLPQLVAAGNKLISGTRRSSVWQAPNGTPVSLN